MSLTQHRLEFKLIPGRRQFVLVLEFLNKFPGERVSEFKLGLMRVEMWRNKMSELKSR